MKKIVILGGLGDGLVAAQLIADMKAAGQQIELMGFLNDHLAPGELIAGVPVLGAPHQWDKLGFGENYFFHPALHKVKKMQERSELIRNFNIPAAKIISLIHPQTVIAANTEIQHGCLIASFVTIQPGAKIGAFNSIRAGANIGHDAVTEDFCYIGPNATLTGKSKLNEGAHLGPNAVVIDGITLEKFCVAAAGATIMNDTIPYSIYIGNPARRISSIE